MFGSEPFAGTITDRPTGSTYDGGSMCRPSPGCSRCVNEPGGSFPSEKPRRVLHHMAFAVEPSQYDGLEARCREAGLEVRQGVHPVLKGVRTFYVDDPEGNEVEVIARELPA